MKNNMFCFQCEQTSCCTGQVGVCGKNQILQIYRMNLRER